MVIKADLASHLEHSSKETLAGQQAQWLVQLCCTSSCEQWTVKIFIGATKPKQSAAESCAPSTGVSSGNPCVPHSGALFKRALLDLSHMAKGGTGSERSWIFFFWQKWFVRKCYFDSGNLLWKHWISMDFREKYAGLWLFVFILPK